MDRHSRNHSEDSQPSCGLLTTASDVIKGNPTRDVGTLCCNSKPYPLVSDKGVMVGTTGIAALKAEYGDDFSKLEIIQDVGYSSESSTHLSGDDSFCSYSYGPINGRLDGTVPQSFTLSLRDELDNAILVSKLLGCNRENDDSGFGASGPVAETADEVDGTESDYLETVLDNVCIDFSKDDNVYIDFSKDEAANLDNDLDLGLNGMESDDLSDTFHKRSSFTTSTQVFYKMISVESDNGEQDTAERDKLDIESDSDSNATEPEPGGSLSSAPRNRSFSSDIESDPDTSTVDNSGHLTSHQNVFCSTPNRPGSCLSLKRKRHPTSFSDFAASPIGKGSIERRSTRVRSWQRQQCIDDSCADPQHPHVGHPCLRFPRDSSASSPPTLSSTAVAKLTSLLSSSCPVVDDDDSSSCDASGEYTSSSDECCGPVSMSSCEDIPLRDPRCPNIGSVETIVQCGRSRKLRGADSLVLLLPPPPPPTPPAHRPCEQLFGATLMPFPARGGYRSSRDVGRCWKSSYLVRALSDGDVRGSAFKSCAKDTLSNTTSPSDLSHNQNQDLPMTRITSSMPALSRQRLDSSLEYLKDSHSDAKSAVTTDSCYQNASYNLSSHSCSEAGKRKRRVRKKSCGSGYSSKGALTVESRSSSGRRRQLSKTFSVSVTAAGNTRRRHFSQSQTDKYAMNGEDAFDLKEADAMMLNKEVDIRSESELERRNSALSPVSDVALTQLEEQSTVSDQVWDGYQDLPYLSEAYSEATVDEDAVRKLTDFGDDYGSAIGQPTRLDPSVGKNNAGVRISSNRKSPKSVKPHTPPSSHRLSLHLDSDSDSEDLHHVIEETRKALNFARSTLQRRQSEGFLTPPEYAELLATSGTHLRCLQTISEHIGLDGVESSFSDSDIEELYALIQEWKLLQKSTVMYEKAGNHSQQKYLEVRKSIDNLFNTMSELSIYTHIDTRNFTDWDDLKHNMTKLQMALSTLHETKQLLVAVNLKVHQITTEHGQELSYKDCHLKDEVTELYHQWDDIYEQNESQLTDLKTLYDRWEAYDAKMQDLRSKLKEDSLDIKDCANTRVTSEDKDLEKELKELRYDAGFLEDRLKGGALWLILQKDLCDLGNQVSAYQADKRLRMPRPERHLTASRSAVHPKSSTVEDETDDRFEDALDDTGAEPKISADKEKCAKGPANRFWRVFRVAIPIQLALVLLYCLACYLEPQCCDVLNNFNFSLTPQLRYMRGPPPV